MLFCFIQGFVVGDDRHFVGGEGADVPVPVNMHLDIIDLVTAFFFLPYVFDRIYHIHVGIAQIRLISVHEPVILAEYGEGRNVIP